MFVNLRFKDILGPLSVSGWLEALWLSRTLQFSLPLKNISWFINVI